jgi:drug/metabolite transporter (DMT)-like permease
MEKTVTSERHLPSVPTDVLAFLAIYFLWGGTFLAIRIAVLELPPFLTAGTRFFVAGALLYACLRVRGVPAPSRIEWRNLALLGVMMFVLTYGPLFWAAQYVSSSIVAVIEATLPITTIALEVIVFRTQPFQWRRAMGVAIGFTGVLLLLIHNEGQQLAPLPCLVILAAGVSWSTGTVLSKRLALPVSRPLGAGVQMLLGGGTLLAVSFFAGEMHPFPQMSLKAGIALVYLIVFGSLLAYTSYQYLLGRYSATRVSSHAYVNPLVAVILGHFVAGEELTGRSIAASIIIVASVVLILTKGATHRVEYAPPADAEPASDLAADRGH